MSEESVRKASISENDKEIREKLCAIWLSNALTPGSIFLKPLLEKYGTFDEIYRLQREDYEELGFDNEAGVMKRLCDKDLCECEKILGFCKHYNFGILIYTSDFYPKRLKLIKNPPPVLYVRGRWIDVDSNVCIAVVGTRSYSESGWKATYMITEGLAKCGAVVVTGMASGIDTAATSASLKGSGMTIGVLGTGIERIYPSENAQLFDEMYTRGMLISELPPYASTTPEYFPIRNRIISGLCHGVLVGEGALKSGAMITAAHATEQGRQVFAIPGDITNPESTGVNSLINEGATPVFDAWNILEKYYYAYPHRIRKIENANGSVVPDARSKKRIRVEKGKNFSLGSDDMKKNDRSGKKKILGRRNEDAAESRGSNETLKKNSQRGNANNPELPILPLEALSENERKIYELLSENEFMNMDTVAVRAGLDIGSVMESITNLEILGFAVSGAGGTKKISVK